MADYRDWCGSCGNEINFGGHDPDCDYLHAQRIAAKEQREFEQGLFKKYREMPDEDLNTEAEELINEIDALSHGLRAAERKWEFLRRNIYTGRRGALEQLKEKLGRRYL